MAKKKPGGQQPPDKPSGGPHVTKRVNVGVPEPWHAVMRKLAGKNKQPVLWYLIELCQAEADKAGVPHPRPPWEDDDADE